MTLVTLPEQKTRGKYKVRHDKQGKDNRTVDGILFDSAKEARRYSELKLLERSGEIISLNLQPMFELNVNGIHICNYVADFSYRNVPSNRWIREDVKGCKTREYQIKKRLMKAIHGIEILET